MLYLSLLTIKRPNQTIQTNSKTEIKSKTERNDQNRNNREYNTIHNNILQHNTIQYNMIQNDTILIQYNTI